MPTPSHFGPVSVSEQCVGVVSGLQSAHLSCRPFTSFTNVVYESDIDASGSEDPRNDALGNELRVGSDDVSATTAVHKKRLPAAQRRAAKKSRSTEALNSQINSDVNDIDALRGYESFYKLPSGAATMDMVINSSAGILGWSTFARCHDVVSKDLDNDKKLLDMQLKRDALLHGLGIAEELVGPAMAKRVRFEAVNDGPSYSKPGLCLFERSDPIGDSEIHNTQTWQDVEFEVALDSGSQDHVCDEQDCPGYTTEASPGSSRGQCFIVGDGGRLENKGQRSLNIQPMLDSSTELKSCFQIARVTRPLMSVGRLCDSGMKVSFTDTKAVVSDSNDQEVCVFERKPGGLYTCKFRLKSPSPDFVRRG